MTSTLPDPTGSLTGADREAFEHMASVRAHAEGRARLGDVYVRMFNNPGVAERVGALGEHLRFHGTLPDDIRELVILRYSMRAGFPYEWSHHQRPAHLAGLSQPEIDGITAGEVPGSLRDDARAVLRAVDAVAAKRVVPPDVLQRVTDVHGTAGIVEVVALCGLYALMGYMTTTFDIEVEEGLPRPAF